MKSRYGILALVLGLTAFGSQILTAQELAPRDRPSIKRSAQLPATPQTLQLLQAADELANEGRLKEAEVKYLEIIDICEKASGLDRDFSEVYNNLGVLYLRQHKYADAKKYFQAAIEKAESRNAKWGNPKSYLALTNMSFIDIYEGNYEQAKNRAEEALKIQPGFGPALLSIGIYWKFLGMKGIRQVGDIAGEVSQWEQRDAKNTAKDGEDRKAKLAALKPMGDKDAIDKAEQYLSQARKNIVEKTNMVNSLVNMGFVIAARGGVENHQRAQKIVEEAKKLDPENAYAYALSGWLHQHFRREATRGYEVPGISMEVARQEYLKGLQLVGEDRTLTSYFYYNLACIYALQYKAFDKAPEGTEGITFYYLRKAVEFGYCDMAHLRKDQDFYHMTFLQNEKGEPLWETFLKDLENKVKSGNCVKE